MNRICKMLVLCAIAAGMRAQWAISFKVFIMG